MKVKKSYIRQGYRWCLIALLASWLEAEGVEKSLKLFDKKIFEKYLQFEKQELSKKGGSMQYEGEDEGALPNQEWVFHTIELYEKDKAIREVAPIEQKYICKKISTKDIYNLVGELSNYFLSKGYSTSIVVIKKIDTKAGILEFELKYGYVKNIYLNGERGGSRLFMGMPLKSGDIFNIRDLDMGIENLNNASKNLDVTIKANEEEGYSDIFITDTPKPIDLSATFDNSGSQDKGTYKINLGFGTNGVMGLNEIFRFYFNTYPIQNSENQEYGFYLSYLLPIGYNQIYYTFQGINSTSSNAIFKSTSNAQNHTLGYKRILYRTQNQKLGVYSNLLIKDRLNKVNDIVLELSSKTYLSMLFGVEYSISINQGFIYTSAEYEAGIPTFSTPDDSLYDPQFNKINLNLIYQQNIPIKDIAYLTYSSNLSASYSPKTLLNINKFLVGDQYSVRGFKEYSAALDYGAYMQNTLYFGAQSENIVLKHLSFFLGLDFGYGRDYLLPKDDVLVGSALGVQYRNNYLDLGFTLSKALYQPKSIPDNGWPIYFHINVHI